MDDDDKPLSDTDYTVQLHKVASLPLRFQDEREDTHIILFRLNIHLQAVINIMYWSTEDTFKLLGLLLFIGSFIIVLQQLLSAEARLNFNNSNKEGEKKTE